MANRKRLKRRPQSLTPAKRAVEDLAAEQTENKRRSSRLVGKVINFREASENEEDGIESEASGRDAIPRKKAKTQHSPNLRSAKSDSDFVQDQSEADDEIMKADEESTDDESLASDPAPKRAAARKAQEKIQSTLAETKTSDLLRLQTQQLALQRCLKPVPSYMKISFSAEVLQSAAAFSKRTPIYLRPPLLSSSRLKVDELSIHLYAADGCTSAAEMWASALSSTRFNGPRRHPPFRELYRLTDPEPQDTSDWAENIRWAKEQHREFASETWTEYEYHLECITEHRRAIRWASEEAIQAGM